MCNSNPRALSNVKALFEKGKSPTKTGLPNNYRIRTSTKSPDNLSSLHNVATPESGHRTCETSDMAKWDVSDVPFEFGQLWTTQI